MIREERESVFCRELVIGNAEVLHTELGLDEVEEAKGEVLRLCICLLPFARGHIYAVDIVVISVYRPVDHILSSRKPAVGDHHLSRPESLACLKRLNCQRIVTGICKHLRIIAFRSIYSHIGIRTVILQDCDIGQVLDDVIGSFRSYGLPCLRGSFHTYAVLHSAGFSDVTELGGVDEHVGCHYIFFTFLIPEFDFPEVFLAGDVEHCGLAPEREQVAAGCGYIRKHFLADARFKVYVADPAGLEGVPSAISLSKRVGELAEYSSLKPVVAVDAAHAGAGEHSAHPGSLFHNHHRYSHPGSLHCCRNTTCSSSDNQNVYMLSRSAGRHTRRRPNGGHHEFQIIFNHIFILFNFF